MSPDARQPYRLKSESYYKLSPTTKDTISANFNKDTNMTYENALDDIDSWCGVTTTRSLLGVNDVKTYAEDPVPNLLEDQRCQRQEFCTKVTTNFLER